MYRNTLSGGLECRSLRAAWDLIYLAFPLPGRIQAYEALCIEVKDGGLRSYKLGLPSWPSQSLTLYYWVNFKFPEFHICKIAIIINS